jgi:5-carboxymethyl-2-hydroxymuconate isomerase
MPHLRLEYTANVPQKVDFSDLLAELQQTMSEVGNIPIANFKSRAYRLEDYCMADGASGKSFVHLDVQFLEGRPLELKQRIGEALMGALKARYAPAIAQGGLELSVELREIQRAVYFKA